MNTLPESGRRSSVCRLKPAPNFTHPVTFHYEIQHHTTRMQKLTKAFKVYRLTVLTLICVLAGLVIGLISRTFAKDWTERQFMYIEMPGELYLRFLKLMIIPLIVSNVILSFGTIQGKLSSHLAKVASFLYLGSNLMAITVAIVLALLICPGKKPAGEGGNLSLTPLIQIDNHHYFTEYHDSIKRYREYHPMFYHTDRNEPNMRVQQRQSFKSPSRENNEFAFHQSRTDLSANQNHHSSPQINLNSSSSAIISNNSSLAVVVVVNGRINSSTHQDARFISSSENKQTLPLSEARTNRYIAENESIKSERGDRDKEREEAYLEPESEGEGEGERVRLRVTRDEPAKNNNHLGLSTKLPIDVLLDVFRNLIPDSIIGATLQQARTRLFAPNELIIFKNGSTDPPPSRWPMGHEVVDQANIIGLLAMSVMTGVILSHMEEASKPMLDLCACISELSLRIGMIAINLTPFCIMFLMIGQIARARDLTSMAGELLMYSLTVIIALFVYGFILLPLVYYLITKKSPIKFLFSLLEALIASFATSSSSATMPLLLNCLVDLELNPVIVRAFGPLGSVFNMNGTAIYEAIGAIFIAKTLGVQLPLTSLLLVGLSSSVASLSTTGIPSSGMMTMVIVLNAINLPVLQLSLIYIVDFIIDRFRTVINVWSGAIVCGLIDHICPEHLFEEEMKPEKYQEMVKYRGSRATLSSRRSLGSDENQKPQVISVTITPPSENSRV